eukprot:m.96773 g.96773  ORF g.96773 m.96773 type:complete len:98 (-) comp51330_c0_seq5:784-1077(-)
MIHPRAGCGGAVPHLSLGRPGGGGVWLATAASGWRRLLGSHLSHQSSTLLHEAIEIRKQKASLEQRKHDLEEQRFQWEQSKFQPKRSRYSRVSGVSW